MGVSSSRIEDDKALLLCRERKRFVRQALDGRCALAAAHVAYIQSLKNTGMAIRKFVEPEAPVESSLYTSTSATPEPLALTDKSASQFSNSSPSFSQHVEALEPFSPIPSPPYSGRFHVNYMKSSGNYSTTVEERLPNSVTATVQSSSDASLKPALHSDKNSTFEVPPPPPDTPWDYFGLFHPIDNQFSFHDGGALNHGLENGDDIRRLREEEGIPELEEEGEKASSNERPEYLESEDEFDQPSTEPLVRIFKNRNEVADSNLINGSSPVPSVESTPLATEQQNWEKALLRDGKYINGGTPDVPTANTTASVVLPSIIGKKEAEKETVSDNKLAAKDFLSSVKEIEYLFLKASESGKEVLMKLEANKLNFRPLLSVGKAQRLKASTFLTAFLVCCKEEVHIPQEPAPNEIKYLTWHRSISSRSSSSRNPLCAAAKDDTDDGGSNLYNSGCMNSGSHASTLDRLYAWERKLYDEVKASGIIRREYDMKCKLLRHQDSKAESAYKIDKTRAAVKDLHSRIRVAIQRINSVSKKIEELRDNELQKQLEELIRGLTRMWAMMLECHKFQFMIISMAFHNGNSKISIQSESHRQATIVLEYELHTLCSSFTKWIIAHKTYLKAINGWLLKCVLSVKQKSRRRKTQFSPGRDIAPPIYVTCRNWLAGLDELPTKKVADAVRELVAETTHFLPRQDKNRGYSSLMSSLSRKVGRSGDLAAEDMQRKETPVEDVGFENLQSGLLENLQSGLVDFLDQLRAFAEKSVKMYGDLGMAIQCARERYDNPGTRT